MFRKTIKWSDGYRHWYKAATILFLLGFWKLFSCHSPSIFKSSRIFYQWGFHTVNYFSCNCFEKHLPLRMLIGDCRKKSLSSTRYLWDFPESSRHIQQTVPMPDGRWPFQPIVATPWFAHFLISPTNMFSLLQMCTFALLSQTIVAESESYFNKSLVLIRSSTLRTVVNAELADSTNKDLLALFLLICLFFLWCQFLLYLIPLR